MKPELFYVKMPVDEKPWSPYPMGKRPKVYDAKNVTMMFNGQLIESDPRTWTFKTESVK